MITINEAGNYWLITQDDIAYLSRRIVTQATEFDLSREELLISRLCQRIVELEDLLEHKYN